MHTSQPSQKKVTNKEKSKNSDIIFLAMPPIRLYILSVLTFNLYDLYWFYKNWKSIKIAEKSTISPFGRAIFVIFFVYSLFKKLLGYSKKQGYKKVYSSGGLATLYIILVFAGNALTRTSIDTKSGTIDAIYQFVWTLILIFLTPIPLLPVQKAINFNNSKINTKDTLKKHPKGEIILIAIGVIIFIISIISFAADVNKYHSSKAITAEKTEIDTLTKEYETCSTNLLAKEKSIDRYSQIAINQFNSELQSCENIRLEQNASVNRYNTLIGK